jgi:thiol-disulfide isomerase/thioredoxin
MLAAAVAVLAGILFLVMLVNFWKETDANSSAAAATQVPGVGRPYAGFQVEPLVGSSEPLTIEQLNGKITLVNFWGPWCGYCLIEMPQLVELERELDDRHEFQLVWVSSGGGRDAGDQSDLSRDTEECLRSRGYEFPVYWDPNARARLALLEAAQVKDASFGYPTNVLVDRKGVIRGIWAGYAPSVVEEMTQLVQQLLAETG